MVQMLNALRRESREIPLGESQQRRPGKNLVIQLGRRGVDRVRSLVRRVIERVHHEIDIVERQSCLAEAIADGARRKAPAVFLAVEAFLRGSGHRHTIHDQGGRGVMALRDSVLALVQTRPLSLLEGRGLFQTTYSQDVHSAGLTSPAGASMCAL